MRRFLLAAFLVGIAAPAFAVCPAPLTGKDAGGTTQNFGVTVDVSGNCYGNVALVDGTAAANKAAINASGQLAIQAPPSLPLPSGAAQESGGNLATLAGAVTSSVVQTNMKQVNGITTSTGAGATGTGTQRVGVAQDTTTIAGAAPGTAGTPSANVLSVQGVTSMTPLKADLSGSTVPLPTNAAQETGGNLATIAGAITSSVVQANTKQVNGVTTLAGAGAVGTGAQRVAVGQDTTTIAGSAPGTAGTPSANVLSVQGATSMTPLKVDGSGVTQPVSAASLPLPSGASTAAKQPALGTAGSASSDVISVQGIASMTPLKVDGSAGMTPLLAKVTDGTNTAAVKAASTAPVAADPAVVVTISPNSAGLSTNATSSAAISISTATTTQLVALTSGKAIYVTAWDVIAAGTGNFELEYGTGSNCGTGTTALTGNYNLTAQAGISKGMGIGTVLFVPASNALCAVTSAAVGMYGSVTYAQF